MGDLRFFNLFWKLHTSLLQLTEFDVLDSQLVVLDLDALLGVVDTEHAGIHLSSDFSNTEEGSRHRILYV